MLAHKTRQRAERTCNVLHAGHFAKIQIFAITGISLLVKPETSTEYDPLTVQRPSWRESDEHVSQPEYP